MRFKFPIPAGWIYFFLFLILNSLLVFSSLSMMVKLWLGLLVLFALLFLARSTGIPKDPAPPKTQSEFLQTIPPWLWIPLLGLAFFARFYKLTTLSTWPNLDEASFAFIANRLAHHWDWRFFYGHSQNVFPFFWSLALCFKVLGTSLTSLWLYPAVASALAVPLAYLAARQYFPKGFSFLLTMLFAFSYWALFESRVTMFTALVPAAELFALYAFGRSLKEGSSLPLALALALGFYIYPLAWTPLALLLAASFFYKSKRAALGPFVGTLALTLAPLAYGIWTQYGSYIHALAVSPHRLLTSLSYITGLFWGKPNGDYYGPEWGGFLDPVTGALFFTGLGLGLGEIKKIRTLWLLTAGGCCLLPGMFSSSLEYNRVLFILPFLLVVAGLGFRSLALELKASWRWSVPALLLVLIIGLNLYHLFGAYERRWKTPGPSWETYKSVESYRAYRILQGTDRREGPGICFTNFGPDLFDQALLVSTAPFNSAEQEALDSVPRWFSFTTNENYQSFLETRLSHGSWLPLSPGLDRVDGGQTLGLYNLRVPYLDMLQRWVKAEEAFQEVAYVFLNRPTGTDYGGVIEALKQTHPWVVGDPFLESCYWEKLYYLHLQNRAFGDQKVSENLAGSLEAVRSGLRYGYPAAHLYNELGTYLLMMGKKGEARKAFQDALKANPNFTPASDNLKLIR